MALQQIQVEQLLQDLSQARAEVLLLTKRADELQAIALGQEEFLLTVSHELLTPLNTVLGWAELLRNQKAKEEDLRLGLDSIARNAAHQARIISNLTPQIFPAAT